MADKANRLTDEKLEEMRKKQNEQPEVTEE